MTSVFAGKAKRFRARGYEHAFQQVMDGGTPKKLSTVIRNALLALRRQQMQRKFIFLVKVQSTCKVLLNRPLMWM